VSDGALIEKAAPTMQHSTAQFELSVALGPFSRRGGGGVPGGWWIGTEAHVEYGPRQVAET
jgi:hypothetical protein